MLIGIILIFGIIQISFNFLRIGTQGAAGQFVWYRTNVGKTLETNYTQQGLFSDNNAIDYQFGAKDIFNLQFGHYNKFLDHVNGRDPENGVYVA